MRIIPCFGLVAIYLVVAACVSSQALPPREELTASDDLAKTIVGSDGLVTPDAGELRAAEHADKKTFDAELEFADHEQREAVQRWITYFSVNDRERFARFLARGERYKALVETILKKQGVPTYFYYLALIESGFQVQATSHAQAAGMWQFIKPTALRFGLKVDPYIDERRDPFRATVAAAHHLRGLHKVFNSWFLAMAAYNAGESRIMNTILRHGSRDFWHLAKIQALPRETRNYVPKFIAAALIGADPAKYGFTLPAVEAIPALQATPIPSPIEISKVSRTLGISMARIREYNPNLLGDLTSPSLQTYHLWLPAVSPRAMAALSALPRARTSTSARPGTKQLAYRVRQGDSLSAIAKKHGTSVAALRHVNRLRNTAIHPGQTLHVPAANAAERTRGAKGFQRYRVQRGDSLARVAARFGMSLKALKRINALARSSIYPGQTLQVMASRH